MRARQAAAPLAASLFAHGALLAAGLGLLASAPAPAPRPASLAREATAARLVLLPAAEGEGGASGPGTVVSLDDPDPARRPYLQELKARIWERWEAPRLARGESGRGALALEFTLSPGGALTAAGVTEGSGSTALDRAALEAVRSAAPFPPVPERLAAGPLRVRARFVYE